MTPSIRVDGNAAYSFVDARFVLNELSPISHYRRRAAVGPGRSPKPRRIAPRRRHSDRCSGKRELSGRCAGGARRAGGRSFKDQAHAHRWIYKGRLRSLPSSGPRALPVVIGQGSACTTILSAAEMQLHCALKNAQPGGEMTGFMRLGEQDIFSPITVTRGKAMPP